MPNDLTGPHAPEGYMRNVFGHLVPTHMVRPELRLQDQLVKDLLTRADRLRGLIAAEKAAMMSDVRAFLALLDEKYGVKRVGQRGGVVLDSFDGDARVTISVGDSITLGPELSAARALIDECIGRWAAGADEHLKALVDDAFKVGETGKLAVDRVLALRRIEIDDPTGAVFAAAYMDVFTPAPGPTSTNYLGDPGGSGGTFFQVYVPDSHVLDLVINNVPALTGGAGPAYSIIVEGFSDTSYTDPVPEPATLSLAFAGLTAVVVSRRRMVSKQ